jgi:hypothetical protein
MILKIEKLLLILIHLKIIVLVFLMLTILLCIQAKHFFATIKIVMNHQDLN